MAITRVYSTWVIGGAGDFADLLSCVGKLAAAIQIIPLPVMGGVSLLLYGVIGVSVNKPSRSVRYQEWYC